MPVSLRHLHKYLYGMGLSQTDGLPTGVHNGRNRKPKFMKLSKYTKAIKPSVEDKVIPAFPPMINFNDDPMVILIGSTKPQRPAQPSCRSLTVRERTAIRKRKEQTCEAPISS